MGKLASQRRRCEGQALYEALLCIMLLMMLLVGTFDFSRLFIVGQRLQAAARTNIHVSSAEASDAAKAAFFQRVMFSDFTGDTTVGNSVQSETMPAGTYDPSGYFTATMPQIMVGRGSNVAFAYRPLAFLRDIIGDPHTQSVQSSASPDCLNLNRSTFFQDYLPQVLTSMDSTSRDWVTVEGID